MVLGKHNEWNRVLNIWYFWGTVSKLGARAGGTRRTLNIFVERWQTNSPLNQMRKIQTFASSLSSLYIFSSFSLCWHLQSLKKSGGEKKVVGKLWMHVHSILVGWKLQCRDTRRRCSRSSGYEICAWRFQASVFHLQSFILGT